MLQRQRKTISLHPWFQFAIEIIKAPIRFSNDMMMNSSKAAKAMTYLRPHPHYVSTACTSRSFACVQPPACSVVAAQSTHTSRRSIATNTNTAITNSRRSPLLDRLHQYQHQQQIASYTSIATMPTPTASRVAIIGAGTVGATIAFSLIGMWW